MNAVDDSSTKTKMEEATAPVADTSKPDEQSVGPWTRMAREFHADPIGWYTGKK